MEMSCGHNSFSMFNTHTSLFRMNKIDLSEYVHLIKTIYIYNYCFEDFLRHREFSPISASVNESVRHMGATQPSDDNNVAS